MHRRYIAELPFSREKEPYDDDDDDAHSGLVAPGKVIQSFISVVAIFQLLNQRKVGVSGIACTEFHWSLGGWGQEKTGDHLSVL